MRLLPLFFVIFVSCVQNENTKIEKFFERSFQEITDLSPQWQTSLSINRNQDKLDDLSEEGVKTSHKLNKKHLKELEEFKFEELNPKNQLSFKLMKWQLENNERLVPFWNHGFLINQMFGVQSELPSFMINAHKINNMQDAKNYLARLRGFEKVFSDVQKRMLKARIDEIIPPRFAVEKPIDDIQNLIKDNTLIDDFSEKVQKLEDKETLISEAKKIIQESVKPAYKDLQSFLKKEILPHTKIEGSALNLPQGKEYYLNSLYSHTTTKLTAQEIHKMGLSEVERIHNLMKEIMAKVGFKGDLQQFFKFMQTDSQFKYSDDEKGRQDYITDAKALIDEMESKLDAMFNLKPKARLKVKAVEAYREKSAGLAFYDIPAPDGTRPGTYYINLYDMDAVKKYDMEALAYHEGIPGHHMQLAIAQELEGIPDFQKHMYHTAYVEGWGLYSEYLPKEYGLYQDPYSDFGRLAMELWRACRLVVDTGIHALGWERDKAINYLNNNTPSNPRDNTKAVERYIIMPGQATSYKVGMLKILELRQKAQEKLGEKFDIRIFHDEVLKYGSLPLAILEKKIEEYIARVQN